MTSFKQSLFIVVATMAFIALCAGHAIATSADASSGTIKTHSQTTVNAPESTDSALTDTGMGMSKKQISNAAADMRALMNAAKSGNLGSGWSAMSDDGKKGGMTVVMKK